MRERSNRVFTRLSPGSSPFFLPPWGMPRKTRQIRATAEDVVLCPPPGNWPAVDPTRPLHGAPNSFGCFEIRERTIPTEEQLANLKRQVEMGRINKLRRIRSRSKRRR